MSHAGLCVLCRQRQRVDFVISLLLQLGLEQLPALVLALLHRSSVWTRLATVGVRLQQPRSAMLDTTSQKRVNELSRTVTNCKRIQAYESYDYDIIVCG